MAEPRAWSRYALTRATFERFPTPENEAEAIASYAHWARQFCPDKAHDLITLLCRNLADIRGGA